MAANKDMASGKLFGKDLSQYDELDIDDLLEQLSPDELELLAGEADPDDTCLPPSERNNYKCEKTSTGPLDRKKLINHINEQALKEPDRPELVPYVAGVVRGKKWVPPPPPEPEENDDEVGGTQDVEIDLDDEIKAVLDTATEDEIVDLAAVLGFHSMMSQEQYHASLLNKGKPLGVGWGGVTKATKFKALPPEAPNDTDAEDSIKKLKDDDAKCKELNFNNIRTISDEQLARLFDALEYNTKLENLSMSNVGLCDRHLDALVNSLKTNNALKTLNLETNNISAAGTVRIMEALLKTHSIEEIRLANQRASVLGNKIEMQITEIVEQNPALLRVGIHFEFNDARNRVSRHLQKNLDTFRIVVPRRQRVAKKPTTEAASLSFVLPANNSQSVSPIPPTTPSIESEEDEETEKPRPPPPRPIAMEEDDSMDDSDSEMSYENEE